MAAAEPLALRKLRAWLRRRGFGLRLAKTASQVCAASRLVTLQRTLTPASRVATLLHECGHVLVHLARRRDERVKVAGASELDWRRLSRLRGRRGALFELQEEMVAWDRGEKLGRRLGLRAPAREWQLARTRALMSYARSLVWSPPLRPAKLTRSVKKAGSSTSR